MAISASSRRSWRGSAPGAFAPRTTASSAANGPRPLDLLRALDGLAGVDSAQRRPVQRPIGSCLGDCSQAALRSGDDGIEQATRQWQARRDLILDELADLPVISPDGGWSLLLDAAALGTSARTLSRCLLEHGQIAATPMTAWGPQVAPSYVRLVYSREPAARLAGLRARVQTAVAASSQPK